jgi:hypothetical protein
VPHFVLLILLTLDLPDTNCARLVKPQNGTTSGIIFSFPVSPGEEEIEVEELEELGVKLKISNRRGRKRCPCLAFPAHLTLYSCL